MNLSLNWLSDFVNVSDIDAKAYCDRMTDTGSKVESFELLGEDIQNVVVARVISMERHPDSDHMWICQVDAGLGEPVQIVTGAQNVTAGALVPAAIPVAHLPGDVTIKAGKLRGVESNGMLCSIGELNLTVHDMPGAAENGILLLDESFADKIGMDIRDALQLKDTVVEFEITSNRPDCLSVIGLARETAVSFDRPLTVKEPVVRESAKSDSIDKYLSVAIDAPDLCRRYCARVVKNVKIAPSPLWMRMRLRACGVRPINNIVDITNYVMLEYGQPMHAFDYAQLEGQAIHVRRAGAGEPFKSLDDQDHILDTSMLVIADGKKPCCLAGVMGGANSEITESTKTVVFESANFDGASVRITAKKNGMRTESSGRFEKGLDPENCMPALERACELVELLGAGEIVRGPIDVYPGKKAPVSLPLNADAINRFLGVDLPESYMQDVLRKLQFKVENGIVTAPSFRSDIGCMNDLAEEVIRIYGYNKIESSSFKAEATQGGYTEKQRYAIKTEDALLGMGLSHIHTFSFISPKQYDRIRMPADSEQRKSVVISNPLGEDTSIMRTTAVPSMLEVLARNFNMNNSEASLFEMATVYIPAADSRDLPAENKVLTIGMYGEKAGFPRLKGILENLLKISRISDIAFAACTDDPVFHPGRCASISTRDGKSLGRFGQIHPLTAANFGLPVPVYVADIDFDGLFELSGSTILYKSLPKYPASARDFAFVCDEDLEVGTIDEVIARAGGKLIEDIHLFDIYRGPQLGEGKKSIAIRVTLRAPDHTLTVEETDKITKKILGDLEHKLNISIRN
ncbi:MAG: phenylalanine--tRNA ligase subunit beta [Clostridia bacterium]|nr:phenylalanine--tRNA ligase subunit beta [Clostridia bacterium]